MRHRANPADPEDQAYAALVKAGPAVSPDCVHGYPAGYVVRPWCGTPACPHCRRTVTRWRSVESYLRIPVSSR
jgi:hypothetical protein